MDHYIIQSLLKTKGIRLQTDENVDALYKYLDKNYFIHLYLDKSDFIHICIDKFNFYSIYLYLDNFFFLSKHNTGNNISGTNNFKRKQ